MKISVIMITHNREKFVGNMINDVLGQSFCDFEYIIVDNCSTDRSGRIADSFSREDPRIKVVHLGEDVSIGKARNIGLSHAGGDFITFVDDDDRIEPDYLESLIRLLLSDTDIDCAICGVTELSSEGILSPQCVFDGTYIYTAGEAVEELLKRNRIRAGIPAKMIRRTIMSKYPFEEKCKHEDIRNTYKFLSEARKVAICGTPKYCAVRHGENVSLFTSDSSKLMPEQLEEYLQAFRERTEFISGKIPALADFAGYSEWSYMISMCHKIRENKLEACRPQYDRMKSELMENRERFISSEYIKDFEKDWMEKYIDA